MSSTQQLHPIPEMLQIKKLKDIEENWEKLKNNIRVQVLDPSRSKIPYDPNLLTSVIQKKNTRTIDVYRALKKMKNQKPVD